MARRIFPFSPCLNILLLLLCFLAISTRAQVPTNNTFKIVNTGPLGEFQNFVPTAEYGATYRIITNDVYDFYTFPFRLCFYNTTPTSFVLGIRAGIPDDNGLMRWVWDANRNHPVKENAALSFGRDGNLVLADSDGSLVWQTNTANKGVTGIKLLQNGNLVLYDKKGKFIWQSFDYPVDSLLVGQSLRESGVNKLVSRTSDVDGSDGKYSLVLGDDGLLLYLNNAGQQVRYNGWPGNFGSTVRFNTQPSTWEPTPIAWNLIFEIFESPAPKPQVDGIQQLSKINYNATYSFLRLETDGNVKAYTYYDKVRFDRWMQTYTFFPSDLATACALPTKCGNFGLCQNGMCVACPTPKGLLGWTENCQPPKLGSCGKKPKAKYFKLDGVQSFLNHQWSSDSQEVEMEFGACRDKCTNDCNCKGFVYKQDTSKCLLMPVLLTLAKDVNTTSAYVKY
ncbi:EP1-like glycoprotein 2 [Coffea arabica]|uniref:EP1-like glycoprotein 2 n=1 Tax=Coffea arabica TaxID=13443 RepID=A0A6P6S4Z0_COFAR|nr:EP1-like glycoprotein 2 [Coffea arabica]